MPEELGYYRPPCPALSWRVTKNGKRVISFGDWRGKTLVTHGRLREQEYQEITEIMEMMEEAWQRLRKIHFNKVLKDMDDSIKRMNESRKNLDLLDEERERLNAS